MTGTEFAPNLDLFDLVESSSEGHTVYGTFDRYLGGDHAWGGGIDLKYFFRRYFGIGVEGFVLNAHRGAGFDLESDGVSVFIHQRRSENRAVGEVLGTFTLRYPIPCSRFSPYVWAGAGVIWGGGERDEIIFDGFGGVEKSRYRSIIPSITRKRLKRSDNLGAGWNSESLRTSAG
jgi:hypothetical protein